MYKAHVSQEKGAASQQVVGVPRCREVLTPFSLIESIQGLVYWKLQYSSTAVPMLLWYSEGCIVIQVNEI